MNQVQASFEPLVARFPSDYQQRVRDADHDIDSGTDSGTGDTGASG
jgi:hypothetical protein